jgi:hypothetical protein
LLIQNCTYQPRKSYILRLLLSMVLISSSVKAFGWVRPNLLNIASNFDGSNLCREENKLLVRNLIFEMYKIVCFLQKWGLDSCKCILQTYLPSVSYVSESLPCLPLWMFFIWIESRGEGIQFYNGKK